MTFAEWFNSLHPSTKSFLIVCAIFLYLVFVAAVIYGFYNFMYPKENFNKEIED
jgi:hypothetical protein